MRNVDFAVGGFGDLRLGKGGALLHAALVDAPGSRIRRLAGTRAREVQFHRFLRNEKVSVAAMAASAEERTGERAKGRDVAVIHDTSEIAVGGVELGSKPRRRW